MMCVSKQVPANQYTWFQYSMYSICIAKVPTTCLYDGGYQNVKINLQTIVQSGSATRCVGIFFHLSNPPRPIINRIKRFCFQIRFREDIRTLSSKNSTPRSVSLHRDRLRTVLPAQRPTPHSVSLRGVWLRSVLVNLRFSKKFENI